MLDLVDESLEGLMRAAVPLNARDIDVSFKAPAEEWSGKLSRPTVNVFLWDIRRSVKSATTGHEIVERDGTQYRREVLPIVELQYLITVWTTDHRDERALLSGLLRVFMGYRSIPDAFVPSILREQSDVDLSLARADEMGKSFTLIDRYKPGLNVVVTTAVDTDLLEPLAPPVTGIDMGFRDMESGAVSEPPRRIAGEVADPAAIGKPVTTPRGRGTVNAAGRFLVPGVTGDEVTLYTNPPRTAVVPAEGGIVFE